MILNPLLFGLTVTVSLTDFAFAFTMYHGKSGNYTEHHMY